MRLDQLLDGLGGDLRGDGAVEIAELALDSRRVEAGTLFFCVTGQRSDGHEFASAAIEAGAAALVVQRELEGLGVPQWVVDDSRAAMAPVAARFFGDPTAELDVLAVTGTNGKTTTAFLVRRILEGAGRPCGLLGTVRQVVGGEVEPVVRTTPEAIELQRTFRRMLDSGDEACAIEVSSHALVLGRVDCMRVRSAGFTNLTQDHLDFHADMEEYFAAKRLLFEPDPERREPPAAAAVNVEDPYGARIAETLGAAAERTRTITFSASGGEADLVALEVDSDASGTRFELRAGSERHRVETSLVGRFNVENCLAALGIAIGAGVELRVAVAALAEVDAVPGRMEPVDEGQPFGVVVDYAHTPEALENVLASARELCEGRLICAFGCGGDRDRAKRPLMGVAAASASDLVVVTSDNPRSEDPGAIIGEILAGVGEVADVADPERVLVEEDRRAALELALGEALAGDLVVIAGKGHETGQEFAAGRTEPFDDRDVARELLAGAAASAGGGVEP